MSMYLSCLEQLRQFDRHIGIHPHCVSNIEISEEGELFNDSVEGLNVSTIGVESEEGTDTDRHVEDALNLDRE